ncbi:PDT-domain-containing protein [Hypoxylon trugodes]|uniref:PDT-domain-containing protein n=1 Tax=Hypoxylon trugodes TaxID=326681 RepID=UPI002197ACC7|nr:PDT-domain-containing protein [Hypoxylon trugodes]KAI1393774.1 PDT-domain-containing protein [Hypoxylon trugodes]
MERNGTFGIVSDGGQDSAESSGKPTVCFLGPVSSYTHQATLNTFSEGKFDLLPVETIKDIFDTTQSGRAALGVVPFENSTNGSVVFTLDQFADRAGEYPNLSVCVEIYLDVHHCLLGHISPSQTQSQEEGKVQDLKHVKRIYSHPQAFGQCTKFLRQYLKGIETVDVSSTSRAAELAAADETGESAAISSIEAAKRRGLDVLAKNIEDRADNTTRFFVLTRNPSLSSVKGLEDVINARRPQQPNGEGGDGENGDIYAHTKSLASFTVPHRSPGALADVLECFRRARLNLTSINSRPSLIAPFQYVFFVEFEGHRDRDPESRVRDALKSVAGVAESCRWLGSWDSMR